MVQEQTLRHIIDCDWETYWPIYMTDESFNGALRRDLKLNVEHVDCVWRGEGDGRRLVRTKRMRPDRNVPGFVDKLIRGASTVTEENIYDPTTGTLEIRIELPVVGSRTEFRGTYRSNTLAPGRHEQIFSGTCKVNIPLVGGKLEGFFMQEMTESVTAIATFAQQWLAEHPQAPNEAA